MPTETNDFNGEEYAIEFDQFDVSAEHTLSPENQETETGESDCDTSETVDAAGPAECIEPGMQAVIDQKGGKTHSWELQYRGDSGYFFDGEQARDPEGSVWTNEDIALHEEMLAQWKEGGSTVFFLPDYKEQAEDGEVLYVTMLMLGEDGRITYEIYSHEMKYHNGEEDSPLPIVEEAGTDIPATPWEEMDELPSELLAPEPISTIEAVFLESHESQEAEGSIVTLEPPISAPPAVERTQEPMFVDTVAETVFVDGTFVDAEPMYPAEDIRDAGATVVEAPQIAASESGIIDDPRDSVTDWMPEAVLVLKGVDQSSMEHRFDERERRTLPHGSEILVRALGIRIPSPRPIGRTHELMVSEIIQVSNSKSPRYSPPGASSYSHIVSTLDGITMRRTA